jgi:hypothetical protein
MPGDEELEVYLIEMRKHPNEDDIEGAREFARAMLSQFAVTDA